MADTHVLARRSTMLRSIGWLGVAEGSHKLGLVLSTLLIARALGASAFGQWSFALALTGLLGLVSDFGLPSATVKHVAAGRDEAAAVIGNGLAMKLLASAIAYGGLVAFAALSGKPRDVVATTLVLGVFAMASTCTLYVQAVFRAMASTHLEAIARVTQQAATLALVAPLALAGASLLAFACAYTGAAFLGGGITLVFLRRRIGPMSLRADAARWRSLAGESWPFWVTGMLWLAYYRIDIVILSFMSSDRQVGLYNMAYNGFQVLTMPASVLVLAIFPSLSHLFEHDRRRFQALRLRAGHGTMAVAVVAAAASALIAGPVIGFVLGPEYAGSLLLFRVLAAALVFLYPNYVLMYTLLAASRRREVVAATGAGAVTNVALNLLLIPGLDALGASIATLATEALMFALLSGAAWWSFRAQPARELTPINELAVAA